MLSLRGGVRIFISTRPTDMRKGFNGLSAIVEHQWIDNPLSGDLFVFSNRRQTLLKILYWDTDGYAIWHKRLEAGTFRIPQVNADGRTDRRRRAELRDVRSRATDPSHRKIRAVGIRAAKGDRRGDRDRDPRAVALRVQCWRIKNRSTGTSDPPDRPRQAGRQDDSQRRDRQVFVSPAALPPGDQNTQRRRRLQIDDDGPAM